MKLRRRQKVVIAIVALAAIFTGGWALTGLSNPLKWRDAKWERQRLTWARLEHQRREAVSYAFFTTLQDYLQETLASDLQIGMSYLLIRLTDAQCYAVAIKDEQVISRMEIQVFFDPGKATFNSAVIDLSFDRRSVREGSPIWRFIDSRTGKSRPFDSLERDFQWTGSISASGRVEASVRMSFPARWVKIFPDFQRNRSSLIQDLYRDPGIVHLYRRLIADNYSDAVLYIRNPDYMLPEYQGNDRPHSTVRQAWLVGPKDAVAHVRLEDLRPRLLSADSPYQVIRIGAHVSGNAKPISKDRLSSILCPPLRKLLLMAAPDGIRRWEFASGVLVSFSDSQEGETCEIKFPQPGDIDWHNVSQETVFNDPKQVKVSLFGY